MLEWVANMCIIVAKLWLRKEEYSLWSGVLLVIWYYIILPNTYLMNTSHNKDLIIDGGLLNTLLKGFKIPFNLRVSHFVCWKNNFIYNSNDVVSRVTSGMNEANKKMSGNQEGSHKKESEIYTIPKIRLKKSQLVNYADSLPNFVLEKQSCSKETDNFSKPLPKAKPNHESTSNSSDEDDSGKCFWNNQPFFKGTMLLNLMKQSVDNENTYLHYFVQLVDYVDKKKIESFLEQNFEIVLHIEHKHSSLDQMQPPKSKGKRLMVNIPSSLPQRLIRKTKLAGKMADRIKTRRIELEKFSTNYAKDISYCQYFDEIIDLEESFIDEF